MKYPEGKVCYWDCGNPVVGFKVNRKKKVYYVCEKHWDILRKVLHDEHNFTRIMEEPC